MPVAPRTSARQLPGWRDNDRIVLVHARALLTSHKAGATDYIEADLRDTGTILAQASKLLDFSEPVAITMLAILHALPDDDDPYGIVGQLMDAVPTGSYLAISHAGSDRVRQEAQQDIGDSWSGKVQQQFTLRSHEQVARFFAGTDLVEPGLVSAEEWRPEPGTVDEGKSTMWCGVGRKR